MKSNMRPDTYREPQSILESLGEKREIDIRDVMILKKRILRELSGNFISFLKKIKGGITRINKKIGVYMNKPTRIFP